MGKVTFGNPSGSWLRQFKKPADLPFDAKTSLILRPLGTLPKGAVWRDLDIRLHYQEKAQLLPFELNQVGQSFFNDLLGSTAVEPQAEILSILNGQERAVCGLLAKAHSATKIRNDRLTLLNWLSYTAEEETASLLSSTIDHLVFDLSRHGRFAQYIGLPQTFYLRPLSTADGRYDLLTIDDRKVFSFNDVESVDFQMALEQSRKGLNNKVVSEIGCGTGINLVRALGAGVRSLSATDLFMHYLVLSWWNIQHAIQTEQVPGIAESRINLYRQSGFAPETANIYLFNTPSIRSQNQIADFEYTNGKHLSRNLSIPSEVFSSVFTELMKRLSKNDSWALWRLLFMVPYHQGAQAFLRKEPEIIGQADKQFNDIFLLSMAKKH